MALATTATEAAKVLRRDLLSVPVHGDRAGAAPMTWGQQAIWRCIQWLGEDHSYFNVRRIWPVPAGCDDDQVIRALASLVTRHEALRTVFVTGGGGLEQRAERDGILQVLRCLTPAGAGRGTAQALLAEAGERPFARGEVGRWPARYVLVREQGPAGTGYVVVVLDHLATDGWGARILEREFTAELAAGSPFALGTTVPRASWQALDQAAYEQSSPGAAMGQAALDRWRDVLRQAPAAHFGDVRHPPASPRFHSYVLSSQAAAVAATALALRHRVTTSAVLLAASVTVFGAVRGTERVAIQLISANRTDRERAGLVAPMAQDVLCVLRPKPRDFPATVRQAASEALAAYCAGSYHPVGLDRVKDAVAAERHAPLDLPVYFNDIRRAESWEDLPALPESAQELEAMAATSEIGFGGGWDKIDAKFFIEAHYAPDRLRLAVQADTAYVSPAEAARWLRQVEQFLIDQVYVTG